MRTLAILLAGGDGDQFGGELPKQFIRLAGEHVLSRSLRTVAAADVDGIVVVAHPDWLDETQALVDGLGSAIPTTVVAGGATRNESTWNGLRSLGADAGDTVLVHDAVRPLLRWTSCAARSNRSRPGQPMRPTPSSRAQTRSSSSRATGWSRIPDRGRYRRGQTPQVFRADVLTQAYEAAARAGDLQATDDCSLVLRYVPGVPVAGRLRRRAQPQDHDDGWTWSLPTG